MRRLHAGLVAAMAASACLSISTWAADAMRIGLVNETTGPNAEAGVYTVNGTGERGTNAQTAFHLDPPD